MTQKEINFPKCKEQKDFENLAFNLIKVLSGLSTEKQIDIFEYAQNIAYQNKNK